jgi:hypothetical protein
MALLGPLPLAPFMIDGFTAAAPDTRAASAVPASEAAT